MLDKLKSIANSLQKEVTVYRLVLKHSGTPKIAKIILGLAIGYAFLPFDLIPDWVPVLGHLDDVVIVPGLVIIALKFIPHGVIEECRNKVDNQGRIIQ